MNAGTRACLVILAVCLGAAPCAADPIVAASAGLADLGAVCVFSGTATEALTLRDAQGVIYVFAVIDEELAVRASSDGGLSYVDRSVAGAPALPLCAEHLSCASSTNPLATVYVTYRDSIRAIRLDPEAGPVLLDVSIGPGEPTGSGTVTDLHVGQERVARHFLAFVRNGRLEWSVVDPVGASASSGWVEMTGTATSIRAASDHLESPHRFHVLLARCAIDGLERDALVAIDGNGVACVQGDEAVGDAGVVAASLGAGKSAIYGVSGTTLRRGSITRTSAQTVPAVDWAVAAVLGFTPTWLRAYAAQGAADAFVLGAGDGARMAVWRVSLDGGALSAITEITGEAATAAVAAEAIGLYRFSTGMAGDLLADLDAIDASSGTVTPIAASVSLGPSAVGARPLADRGWHGVVWRDTRGPRLVVETGPESADLLAPSLTGGDTFTVSLPAGASGLVEFQTLDALRSELLLRDDGSGLLVRYGMDLSGQIESAACAPFTASGLDYDSLLMVRSHDGSVWVLVEQGDGT